MKNLEINRTVENIDIKEAYLHIVHFKHTIIWYPVMFVYTDFNKPC